MDKWEAVEWFRNSVGIGFLLYNVSLLGPLRRLFGRQHSSHGGRAEPKRQGVQRRGIQGQGGGRGAGYDRCDDRTEENGPMLTIPHFQPAKFA